MNDASRPRTRSRALLTLASLTLAACAGPGSSPVAELEEWLAEPRGDRAPLADQEFAMAALSAGDVEPVRDLLWEDRKEAMRDDPLFEQWSDREFATGWSEGEQRETSMRFTVEEFGSAEDGEKSLYIAMHGGGEAPASVNDEQWEIMQSRYRPEEGLYVVPRAPSNTAVLWYDAHALLGLKSLIRAAVLYGGVDSDRVYLIGYSAGADGIYYDGELLGHRLAGATASAGHPNWTNGYGLRNTRLQVQIGDQDHAYDRYNAVVAFIEQMDEWREQDPGGYEVDFVEHTGFGHQIDDLDTVDWLAQGTRDPSPDTVLFGAWGHPWGELRRTMYWLWMDVAPETVGGAEARLDGDTVDLLIVDVPEIRVRLDDSMTDLDAPVTVRHDGEVVFEGVVERTIATLAETMAETDDPSLSYPAEVRVEAR